LTPDTQRVLEELFSAEEPIVLSRNGRPFGGMIAYRMENETTAAVTPEEERDILDAVTQGESDYRAGNYLTLEQFKVKHAARLHGATE
jgi:hypothetical protein